MFETGLETRYNFYLRTTDEGISDFRLLILGLLEEVLAIKIILIRHGKPTHPFLPNLNRNEFEKWLKDYDASGLVDESQPTESLKQQLTLVDEVWVSRLRRSKESGERLFPKHKIQVFNDIHEVEIGLPPIRSSMKFSTNTWVYLSRVLWHIGFDTGVESKSEVYHRFHSTLRRIEESRSNCLAIVAHGWFNLLFSKRLRNAGWRRTMSSGHGHWGYSTFERR